MKKLIGLCLVLSAGLVYANGIHNNMTTPTQEGVSNMNDPAVQEHHQKHMMDADDQMQAEEEDTSMNNKKTYRNTNSNRTMKPMKTTPTTGTGTTP